MAATLHELHFSEMHPSRLGLGHPCLAIGLIVVHPFIVPKGCIGDHIKDYKEDEDNNVDNRDLPPAVLKAG